MYSRLVSETYAVFPTVFPVMGSPDAEETTAGVATGSLTVATTGLETGLHAPDVELNANFLPNFCVVWPFVGDDGNVIVCVLFY
jgi:hypothetical protein